MRDQKLIHAFEKLQAKPSFKLSLTGCHESTKKAKTNVLEA